VTYVLLAFIFFSSSRNLQASWADRGEIFHDARKCVLSYFEEPPKKILRAKNVQSLTQGRLQTLTANISGTDESI